jgi:hypothetical protein
MSSWRGLAQSVAQQFVERRFVPIAHFEKIQVIDRAEAVKFIEVWGHAAVFDFRQATEVKNKIWTPTPQGQFVAGALHISIGESEPFARFSERCAWNHSTSRPRPIARIE